MFHRDIGKAAIAAVTQKEREHAFDQLRPYNGKSNSWGKRNSLISTVGMLRERYGRARCYDEGVADCVRCQTMSLVHSMERLLAATAAEEQQNG